MPKINFTTPVGRLVMGSLYTPQTTNMEGQPLTVKSGPNAGQPTVKYFFALAIPKGGEQHWSQTEWGQKILSAGQQGFPQGQWQTPTFAWKCVDGDSAVPNAKGKANNTREGYPGNWVLSFSSQFAPKIYNKDGSAAIVEPGAVKLGYYVQVNADVDGNGSLLKPGVYLNHNMVALSGFGPEIQVGPDPAAAGFGAAPLPAGASAAPVASFTPPVGVPGAAPAVPLGFPPAGAAPAPFPGGIAPPASPSSAVAAAPNYAFMGAQAPAAPATVPALPPPAPPIPAGPVMTAAANGATYAQMLAAGWTDATLRQHGMML